MNLFIFTLIGTGLQTAFTIPSLLYVVQGFAPPPHTNSIFSPLWPFPHYFSWPTIETLIALYFIVPIIFCTIVSSRFKPKRIIPLINIQLTTVVFFGFASLVGISAGSENLRTDYGTFAAAFVTLWVLSLFLFAIVGVYETSLVRWLIGVNEGNIERKTYSVSFNFDSFRSLILNEFKNSYDFRIEREAPTLLVVRILKTPRVILGIGPDRFDSSKSILCLVPCALSLYELKTDKEARKVRDDILFNLRGRLTGKAEVTETIDDAIVS